MKPFKVTSSDLTLIPEEILKSIRIYCLPEYPHEVGSRTVKSYDKNIRKHMDTQSCDDQMKCLNLTILAGYALLHKEIGDFEVRKGPYITPYATTEESQSEYASIEISEGRMVEVGKDKTFGKVFLITSVEMPYLKLYEFYTPPGEKPTSQET